jgi:DNA modification methylase
MSIQNSTEWRSVPIDRLKPYGKTLRRHDRRKVNKLKKLIGYFGQVVPVIIDTDHVIVDGHAVWQAMREMGAGEIATITVANHNATELKALRLALNRLPQDAGWDKQALRAEFEELVSISFDLEITGFDTAEIDHILDLDIPHANIVEDEEAIAPLAETAVSAPGDIWICGDHRIGCGSALDRDFVEQVAAGAQADVAFTDPPYNVPVDGFISGKGKVRHREFVQGTGEMSAEAFAGFLVAALSVLNASCKPRALLYSCMDWRHIGELIAAGKQCDLRLYNICVWVKSNAGMGSLYRNQHELVAVFQGGDIAPVNNVELGRHGRNRSNVWNYRGFNSFGNNRDELLSLHPTVKPIALIADVLRDVTKRGGSVLDTFLGSGSTLVAAEETGRRGFGVDLDPLYVDIAVRRLQKATRLDVVHAETGELFDERADRLANQGATANTAEAADGR